MADRRGQQLPQPVIRGDAAAQRLLHPLVQLGPGVGAPQGLGEVDRGVRLGGHPEQPVRRVRHARGRLGLADVVQGRLDPAAHGLGGRPHRVQVCPGTGLGLDPTGQRRRHGDLGRDVVGLVAGGPARPGRPVLHLAQERRGLLGGHLGQVADRARIGPVVGLDQFVAQSLQREGVPGAQQLAGLMRGYRPDAAAGQDQLGAHPFGIGLIGVGGCPGSAVGLDRRRPDLAVHGGGQPRRQPRPRVPSHGLVSTAGSVTAQSIRNRALPGRKGTGLAQQRDVLREPAPAWRFFAGGAGFTN